MASAPKVFANGWRDMMTRPFKRMRSSGADLGAHVANSASAWFAFVTVLRAPSTAGSPKHLTDKCNWCAE
jgi:hypothetical protein